MRSSYLLTSFEILVSQTAARELKALEKWLQERIKEKLRELAKDPSNSAGRLDVKKLSTTGRNYSRLKVGDYRVIFSLEERSVKVVRIAKRSDVYSWLD